MRIFYHQGECLQIYLRQGTPETDAEEIIAEIVARLSAVTGGAETQVRTLEERVRIEEIVENCWGENNENEIRRRLTVLVEMWNKVLILFMKVWQTNTIALLLL